MLLILLLEFHKISEHKAIPKKDTRGKVSLCPLKMSRNLAALWFSFNRFKKLNRRSRVVYPNPGLLGLCYLFSDFKKGSPENLISFFKISVLYKKSI